MADITDSIEYAATKVAVHADDLAQNIVSNLGKKPSRKVVNDYRLRLENIRLAVVKLESHITDLEKL